MNKKVYIRQDGTIPGHRIIEELEKRGGKATKRYGDVDCICYYLIKMGEILRDYICPNSNYTELLYNKETDSFYENSPILSNSSNIGKILEGEYTIPEGYEATIEDGKVIVSKKKWLPKRGEKFYFADINTFNMISASVKECTRDYSKWDEQLMKYNNFFRTKEEALDFCYKLNYAIACVLDERKKELEG